MLKAMNDLTDSFVIQCNKIATRSKNLKASGQGSQSPMIIHSLTCMRPALLTYLSLLLLNIFIPLAQSVDNVFHPFTVLCENE